jgi:hypothetical protein
MNTPCPFDLSHLSFVGSPADQARCLLRFVKRVGNVDDTPAALPPVLDGLLGAPQTVSITKAQLRSYLQKHGIPASCDPGKRSIRTSSTRRAGVATSFRPSRGARLTFTSPAWERL